MVLTIVCMIEHGCDGARGPSRTRTAQNGHSGERQAAQRARAIVAVGHRVQGQVRERTDRKRASHRASFQDARGADEYVEGGDHRADDSAATSTPAGPPWARSGDDDHGARAGAGTI
jgi:hypothetical protein